METKDIIIKTLKEKIKDLKKEKEILRISKIYQKCPYCNKVVKLKDKK